MFFSFSKYVKKEHFFLILLNLVFFAIAYLLRDGIYTDPDRFYHYYVSEAYLTDFIPKSLQRITGLGWNHSFPEKEFFYHVLCSLFYFWKQDNGLRILSLILGTVSVNIWYACARTKLSPLLSFSLISSLLLSPQFILRLVLIRPHTLAVLLFAGLCLGFIKRNKLLVFAFCLLFNLSYHAFYIPLALTIFLLVFSWVAKKYELINTAKYGLLGMALGLFLNPYFPDFIYMSIKHFWIALEQFKHTDLAYGPELALHPPLSTLKLFLPHIVLSVIVLTLILKKLKSLKHLLLFMAAITATLAQFLSIRFFEYTPSLFLLLLSLAPLTEVKKIRRAWIALGLAGLFCLANFNYIKYTQDILHFKKTEKAYQKALYPVAQIKHVKVYNCDWWEGHYALHFSKLDVLDVLDPSLLMTKPELFQLSYNLKRSIFENEETISMLKKNDYHYVICSSKRQLFSTLYENPDIQNISTVKIEKKLYIGLFGVSN